MSVIYQALWVPVYDPSNRCTKIVDCPLADALPSSTIYHDRRHRFITMPASECVEEPWLVFQGLLQSPVSSLLVQVHVTCCGHHQQCQHEELTGQRCPDTRDISRIVDFPEYGGRKDSTNPSPHDDEGAGD
jgi:hypothetical protein